MTVEIPADSVVDAWIMLIRAQSHVLGAVEHDLKKAGFPPLSWYDVALELRRAGEAGLRPLEIEARLLLAQHNVSRLVDRLEKAGLVDRHAHETDGRGQKIRLTAAGHDLLARMWPVYRASIQRHVGNKLKGDGEAATLAELLGRLLAEDRQP